MQKRHLTCHHVKELLGWQRNGGMAYVFIFMISRFMRNTEKV